MSSINAARRRLQRPDLVAAAVCIGFAALAWVAARAHVIGSIGVETDFYQVYAPNAAVLSSGDPYTYVGKPFGYMAVLAGVNYVVRDWFLAGKLISIAGATGMLAMAYLVARRLLGARVAVATSLLYLPVLFPHSFVAATDTLAGLAALLPLWLIARAERHSKKLVFVAGVLCGLAFMIRTFTAWVPAGLALALLLLPHPDRSWRQRMGLTALFAGGCLLGAAPWLVHLTRYGVALGSQQYAAVGVRFLGDGNVGSRSAIFDMREQYASPMQMLREAALSLLIGYLTALPGNAHMLIMGALWFPGNVLVGGGIAAIGHAIWQPGQARRRWSVLAVGLSLLMGVLYLTLITFQPRYYAALMGLVIPIGVAFCFDNRLLQHVSKRWLRQALPWLLVLVMLAMQTNQALRYVGEVYASEPHHLVAPAAWLATYAEPGDMVMERKPHLSYWAGLQRVDVLPKIEVAQDFVTTSRQLGARFVLYSGWDAVMWPELVMLADPVQAPPGLTLVFGQSEGDVLIYEVSAE